MENMASTQSAANICLALLIGLPGSGKTTLANFLKHHFSILEKDHLSSNIIHICYDDLIPADFSNFHARNAAGGSWREARQEVLSMVKKLICTLKDLSTDLNTYCLELQCSAKNKYIKQDYIWNIAVKKNTIIIIDDNMYYSSMRYLYFQLASCHSLGFCELYLNCTSGAAIAFNRKRSKVGRVPEEVIMKMAERMEPPGNRPWEQFYVFISAHKPFSNMGTIGAVKQVIFNALRNPVQCLLDFPKVNETSCNSCMTSVLHHVDLALRHIVGKRMQLLQQAAVDKSRLQNESVLLNRNRLKLLNAFKRGVIVIPEELCAALQSLNREPLLTFLASLLS